MIALIPARAGSKRIPGKNTKRLGGYPLWQWTTAAAAQSCVFDQIVICTDDTRMQIPLAVGVVWRRPVTDDQPDIEWVREALTIAPSREWCILRPTSPFRDAATIRRAFRQWQDVKDCCDSLRAITPATQTPYKMWMATGDLAFMPIVPILSGAHGVTPYHSSPTQTLPTVYAQTGALEMGWTRNVEQLGTISGRKVVGFLTDGPAACNIDTPDDWARAEALLATDPSLVASMGVAGISAGTPT